MNESVCPCGSGLAYHTCCGRFLEQKQPPPTAEALMRSRYTAYVRGNAKYLYRTWDQKTRPTFQSLKGMPPVNWMGLEVIGTQAGGVDDAEGEVEFIARYMEQGQLRVMREVSRFRRDKGRWVYVVENTGV